MLVNIHHDSKREHNRLLVAGIALLVVMTLLIWLSIAIYNKAFSTDTMITIKSDRAGLQLAKFGDVRLNGVLIGQVRKVEQDGKEASIEVALQPSVADDLPTNVNVQILPTTLFGQKYVSFVVPGKPSSTHLENNDVIPSSQVEVNVELSRILAELFPSCARSGRPTSTWPSTPWPRRSRAGETSSARPWSTSTTTWV